MLIAPVVGDKKPVGRMVRRVGEGLLLIRNGDKPLPEGRGEGGSGKLPVLYAKPPQPKGWWDF